MIIQKRFLDQLSKAEIQIQDISGRWFTISTVMNNDLQVKNALDSAVKTHKKRARAITPNGTVIDIR